jgi:hypothetical protein
MATLQQTVDRWTGSAGTAGTRYTEGVQGTTVDVVGRAIANQAALVNNFNQAVSSGMWARRLGDVGTTGWKTATVAKAANYTTGFSAGATKFQQAMQTWLPIIQGAAQQVKNTPAPTFAAKMQRAVDYATILHNAKLSR